jgi:predicted lipoprotein with Yx(FWY)xxD motif
MRKVSIVTTVLAAGVLVLSACGSDDGGDTSSSGSTTSSASSSSSPATSSAALMTADTDLGNIVVDGKGMTVYMFDKDTKGSGKSNCSGECLTAWPPVVAESDSPTVDGVTGEVGTITRDDGTKQVTLDGWPLYYWQGDKAPGDTTGQAVQGVWWVLTADGAKVTKSAAPASLRSY